MASIRRNTNGRETAFLTSDPWVCLDLASVCLILSAYPAVGWLVPLRESDMETDLGLAPALLLIGFSFLTESLAMSKLQCAQM